MPRNTINFETSIEMVAENSKSMTGKWSILEKKGASWKRREHLGKEESIRRA